MKTKTYNTWKFEELPEETQEEVLERYRYFNVEDSWWYEYEGKTGFTAKELQRMRVKPADAPVELINHSKIYFDIGRNWYIQFVDAEFSNDEIARKFLRVEKRLWENVHWTFINNRDYTTRLEYELDTYSDLKEDFTPREIEILDRAVEIFSDKMEEALRGLRDDYEYQCSDEAVKESLICNDYDFTEDGKID